MKSHNQQLRPIWKVSHVYSSQDFFLLKSSLKLWKISNFFQPKLAISPSKAFLSPPISERQSCQNFALRANNPSTTQANTGELRQARENVCLSRLVLMLLLIGWECCFSLCLPERLLCSLRSRRLSNIEHVVLGNVERARSTLLRRKARAYRVPYSYTARPKLLKRRAATQASFFDTVKPSTNGRSD